MPRTKSKQPPTGQEGDIVAYSLRNRIDTSVRPRDYMEVD